MNTLSGIAFTVFVSLSFSFSTVNAALIDRGNGMIYDTDYNITWASNANINGAMSWDAASLWAENLEYGGYSDWRLPTSTTCIGYACTSSELGHLFYSELGGVAISPISITHNANYSMFSNLQDYYYWTSLGTAPNTTGAWTFTFVNGYQNHYNKGFLYHALVVRDGDVEAIPLPAAIWLFSTGLLGLVVLVRRQKNTQY